MIIVAFLGVQFLFFIICFYHLSFSFSHVQFFLQLQLKYVIHFIVGDGRFTIRIAVVRRLSAPRCMCNSSPQLNVICILKWFICKLQVSAKHQKFVCAQLFVHNNATAFLYFLEIINTIIIILYCICCNVNDVEDTIIWATKRSLICKFDGIASDSV